MLAVHRDDVDDFQATMIAEMDPMSRNATNHAILGCSRLVELVGLHL